MSTEKTVRAFNIGANSNSIEISSLIVSAVFSVLIVISIYIILKSYDELKNGGIKIPHFFKILLRTILFIVILGYFLLR